MTKKYEETIRGSLQDLQAKIENDEITLKGEFVIVIEGTEENTFDLNFSNKIKELYLEHLPAKDAAKLISALSNQSKREVYKWLIDK
jgi:16S rRNA (cytidine1402-2'-O)-methyltransferase